MESQSNTVINRDLLASEIAVYLARIFAVASLVLCAVWGSENYGHYLGKPTWRSNAMSWHALLMVPGFYFCTIIAITMYWTPVVRYAWEWKYDMRWLRGLHYFWRAGALGTAIGGLMAAVQYTQSTNTAHLSTFHSWIGVIALVCLFYFAAVDICRNIFWGLTESLKLRILCLDGLVVRNITFMTMIHNVLLGVVFTTSVPIAVITGITDYLNLQGGCTYSVDLLPPKSSYYSNLSSGCKIGNGLGITVLLAAVCIMMAISFRRAAAEEIKRHPSSHRLSMAQLTQLQSANVDELVGIETDLGGILAADLASKEEGERGPLGDEPSLKSSIIWNKTGAAVSSKLRRASSLTATGSVASSDSGGSRRHSRDICERGDLIESSRINLASSSAKRFESGEATDNTEREYIHEPIPNDTVVVEHDMTSIIGQDTLESG